MYYQNIHTSKSVGLCDLHSFRLQETCPSFSIIHTISLLSNKITVVKFGIGLALKSNSLVTRVIAGNMWQPLYIIATWILASG